MADDIDVANDLIAIQLKRTLDAMRKDASSETAGTKTCLECGDDMPAVRQSLGFKLCVSCAEEAERRKSLFIDD